MTTLSPRIFGIFFSGICMVFGFSTLKVNDACYDWKTASKRCSLARLCQVGLEGDRDGALRDLGGHTDAVPDDGRRYWVGAQYRSTGLFTMGECETFNSPGTLLTQRGIQNSSHPVLDCYDACAEYRVFALSAETCFCKTTPSNNTRHRCTPEPFYEGSLDFHGGQFGVVEYHKLLAPHESIDIDDPQGNCVSCVHVSPDSCVYYSINPCEFNLTYKCGANFGAERGPWWESITSCEEKDVLTSVENFTFVWTRISRRGVLKRTGSLNHSDSSLKGTDVRCVSVSNTHGDLYTHLEDCLILLPSLCQDSGNLSQRIPPGNLTQTGEQLLSDAHSEVITALAVLMTIASLASLGLLVTAIYFRRQRNQERHRRLQETYVTPSFVSLPEPETPHYTSLQYIAKPHF